MRRPSVAFGLAAALYLLLTIALTWPLVLHPASRVPNDLGDSMLNMFLIAWNARELPLTAEWWNLPQFHPIPGVMSFSEHLLGLSVITTPIIAATGNALLAYNVAFFLSFPLGALAAHLLAYELTGRHGAGVIAGIAFGFAPYRMAQFAHIQVLSLYWIPLALLGLHLFLRDRRWRWAVLFAGAWLMQVLTCGYYLFYLSVLVGLWILWFAVGRLRPADLARLLVSWGVAIVAMIPVALGYLKFSRAYGLKRWPDEIESFSADVASVLTASGNLRVWGWLNTIDRPESAFFPGVTMIAIIGAGVILAWSRAARTEVRRLRTARVLLAISAVFAVVAATPAWLGPWRIEIGSLRLLSVTSAQKPLSVAVLLAVVALAMHPSIRTGWRQRSPLAFYTIGAVVMWMFSLGPAPTFMNKPFLYKAPYAWLMLVPGVDGVRVPARFWTLTTICLAIAAGLSIAHIRVLPLRRDDLPSEGAGLRPDGGSHATGTPPVAAAFRRAMHLLPAAAAVLLLIESWPRPISFERPPTPRPAHGRAVARLDLPFTFGHDLIVLYRAIEHRRPVINGYSGYFAPHYGALQHLLEGHDPKVLAHLASRGPIEIVIDHDQDPSGQWRAYIAAQPEAEVVHREPSYTAYRLPRSREVFESPRLSGGPLPVAAVRATRGTDVIANMLDGKRVTRWSTAGPQRPGDQVDIDLGAVKRVQGVETQLAGYVSDFPRELAIELSEDGVSWKPVWSGSSAFIAYLAALDDPLNVPLRFAFEATPARFVRLRQLSKDDIFYWTITELKVVGE
jgi:hypothetical protein